MKKMYWRFGAMIATSTTAMFVLMYFNTYEWDHVQWSDTRFDMAFVMGATMAAIMLLFMLGMYKSKVVNAAILGTSVVVFALALWLVRSQTNGEVTTQAELEERPVPEFDVSNGARRTLCRRVSRTVREVMQRELGGVMSLTARGGGRDGGGVGR